ncbi:MAG TPA: glycosyltransferase [Candidatus Babeliales bacterium]|jgi:mannosyltransferase OCH1-like enzyme|nr:glycosyltransferase [Candidatus Babeliales bacterium]
MIIVILALLMSWSTFAVSDYAQPHWHYIPFDDAMKKDEYPTVCPATAVIFGIDGDVLYEFLKTMYENNNFSTVAPTAELKIPKIIHQIWLGSPVPESFKSLQQSWIECHLGRDWRYKLWTDEDVAQMELYNQQFYDETDNYGVKSDILRWEILYTYGGVYVDMDYECLHALDDFHYTYDFYTALQPLDTLFVQLGAALFGSRPGHPILQHCIETIKNDWHFKGAPTKTGPVHFTKSFYTCAGMNDNIDIAFPAFYFYPLGCRETEGNRKSWLQQGAYAVHWWAKSWMPKNYRPATFRDINNDDSAASWNN